MMVCIDNLHLDAKYYAASADNIGILLRLSSRAHPLHGSIVGTQGAHFSHAPTHVHTDAMLLHFLDQR